MAYVPNTLAGADPWLAYSTKYGPVSTQERNLGFENASAFMELLDKLGPYETRQFVINADEKLDVGDSQATPKEKQQKLHDETQKVINHIYESFLTLSHKAKNIEELSALIEKESRLITKQQRVLEAYKRTLSPIPLESKKLEFKNFSITLGRTTELYTGDKIDLKIVGSIFYNPNGRGLKIELKGNGRIFADAYFQLLGNKLIVSELNTKIDPDPTTQLYDFVHLMTQIIFNVWQLQGNETLSLYLKPCHFKSAALGLAPYEKDHTESFRAELVFRRETAHFDYFKKVLTATNPIVPKAD